MTQMSAGGGGAPPPGGEQGATYCPFEDPNLGFFDGFVETLKQVIASPITFFRRVPDTSDIGRPLLFLAVMLFIGSFLEAAWGMIFRPMQSNPEDLRQALEQLNLPPEFIDSFSSMMGGEGALTTAITQIILGPIIGLIAGFIIAGFYHLLLMLFGGANRDFGATFRVVAYTSALQILLIVPMCGGLINLVWALVLWCVGLACAHRTDGWRAVLAVLLPWALCCLCCIGAFAAIVSAVAGAASH